MNAVTKTVVITGDAERVQLSSLNPSIFAAGGNTGIGFETAVALAAQGFRTIIACRNSEKGRAAVERIKSHKSDALVEARNLDLADFSSIDQFAKSLLNDNVPIDVLINNAGVLGGSSEKTKDGLDMVMGTNHFGHFRLTSLLYPLLKNHESVARIVVVSSGAHRYVRAIDIDDINREKATFPILNYSHSKLANLLFTYELARRIPPQHNVIVNACHPGVVATDLGRHFVTKDSNFLLRLFSKGFSSFFKTSAQGALTQIYLASSPEVEKVTGKYFIDSKECRSTAASYDEKAAKKLWDLSNTITGAMWDF